MFPLFQKHVAINALCCKCFMSRRGKGAQVKVVPSGATVLVCVSGSKRGA